MWHFMPHCALHTMALLRVWRRMHARCCGTTLRQQRASMQLACWQLCQMWCVRACVRALYIYTHACKHVRVCTAPLEIQSARKTVASSSCLVALRSVAVHQGQATTFNVSF